MTTQKLLFVIVVMLFTIVAGCSNAIVNEDQKIELQMLVDEENNYKDFKEITDQDDVRKVKEIVFNIEWKKTGVQMDQPADYRFIFQYMNPNIEAKAATYKIWISPNDDIVEIVMEDDSYAKLNSEDSRILIEILTEV